MQEEHSKFDHSGEIISGLVASILHRYTGETLNAAIIDEVCIHTASMIGLVGLSETAQMLDVSKQRIHQIEQGMSRIPMPRAIAKLACGPIWLADDITKFNALRTR